MAKLELPSPAAESAKWPETLHEPRTENDRYCGRCGRYVHGSSAGHFCPHGNLCRDDPNHWPATEPCCPVCASGER